MSKTSYPLNPTELLEYAGSYLEEKGWTVHDTLKADLTQHIWAGKSRRLRHVEVTFHFIRHNGTVYLTKFSLDSKLNTLSPEAALRWEGKDLSGPSDRSWKIETCSSFKKLLQIYDEHARDHGFITLFT